MTYETKMLAYHSDEKLKQSVLAQMRAHREADTLVQGHGYWKDGKGCAVGCLIHSGDHAEYESRFGISRFLARLEDGIFERLPVKEAREWPERFFDAAQTGADLSMVFYKFVHWMLADPQDGILRHVNTERIKKNVIKIATLYKQRIDGEISLTDFRATAAAYAIAAYAVADRDASADYVDYAAAYAAAHAVAAAVSAYDGASIDNVVVYAAAVIARAYKVADAAYDRTVADAWKAKKQQATIKQADKLIELMKSVESTKGGYV